MNHQTFEPIENSSSWYGVDFETDKSWEYHLEPGHIADLEQALHGVKRGGPALAELRHRDYPLPTLA